MRLIHSCSPIKIACDLSGAGVEQAYDQLGNYDGEDYVLYVSPELVSVARNLKFPFLKYVRVRLDFEPDMWALCGEYSGVFSEGA